MALLKMGAAKPPRQSMKQLPARASEIRTCMRSIAATHHLFGKTSTNCSLSQITAILYEAFDKKHTLDALVPDDEWIGQLRDAVVHEQCHVSWSKPLHDVLRLGSRPLHHLNGQFLRHSVGPQEGQNLRAMAVSGHYDTSTAILAQHCQQIFIDGMLTKNRHAPRSCGGKCPIKVQRNTCRAQTTSELHHSFAISPEKSAILTGMSITHKAATSVGTETGR